MKKLICILLTAALLMSVLMSVMVFSASADIVPTGYGYEDNSEAPTEAPTEEEPEPTCEPAPEPTEAALPDPTEPKPTQPTTEPSSTEPTESLNVPSVKYRELIDGTMELYYYSDPSSERIDLVIPDTYDGKAVTSIASDFLDESTREKIYTVTIPDSVTKIEPFAFRYCSVKTVSLGKGVDVIQAGTFCSCSEIVSIRIPDSIKRIESEYYYVYSRPWDDDIDALSHCGAFEGCTKLENVFLPDSVIELGAFTFRNCTSLKNVFLGSGLQSIEAGTFASCTALESIVIPDSVTHINSKYSYYQFSQYYGIDGIRPSYRGAFSDCTALKNVNFGNSVVDIGYAAFSNCTSLESLILPDSVTLLGAYSFSNCTSLKEAFLGNGIATISERAFQNCESLIGIDIPDSVKQLGVLAFSGCKKLNLVSIGKGIEVLNAGTFSGCTSLSKIIIPVNVTQIANDEYTYDKGEGGATAYSGVFEGCTSLEQIDLSDNISFIGKKAFYNTALTSITIKNSNAELGYKAFGVKNTVYGDAPNEDFIVYGYKGSTAEKYAKEYQLKFSELSEFEYLGDVDGDGVVSIIDATCIQRHLASIPVFFYKEAAADTDGDGSVTILDATYIQRWLANLKSNDNIGKPIS